MSEIRPPLSRERFDAILFDLDGVLTATARIHAAAWKEMFDAFLAGHAERTGEAFRPFEIATDYVRYVDGKPRYDGVRDFLKSRSLSLPEGAPGDPPGDETVCALGNRKDELVHARIAAGEVEAYPGSLRFLDRARSEGYRVAVVTSSANCSAVLAAVGIADRFAAQVDGNAIRDLGLAGKPAPDSFLEAARRLGVEPTRSVVVEDALSGVEAGRAGGFGLVIGVSRHGDADALRRHGADHVVADLSELLA